MKEECGIFGIYNAADAGLQIMNGLHELNHRGQESCGIATIHGSNLACEKGMGLVLPTLESVISRLGGNIGIGHTRYSTAGGSSITNAQPFVATVKFGSIAIAHNGTINNATELRTALEKRGAVFQSTSDTEVVLHLIAQSTASDLESSIAEALRQLEGAFSLVMLAKDTLIAIRDPHGFRPLAMGTFENGIVFASETSAFKWSAAAYQSEVKPGEMIIVNKEGAKHLQYSTPTRVSNCVFEHIYFARPDSQVFGIGVAKTRVTLGRLLAGVLPVDADIVVGVPDSGIPAAIGYSEKTKIPLAPGLIRHHHGGRSFIEPSDALRRRAIDYKLSPVKHLLKGQRVILVDDSIVRGNTSQRIVEMVRGAGAKEVHVRIPSPPLIHPCFYGVDIPTTDELIAAHHSVKEICQFIGADTLAYITLGKLMEGVGGTEHCLACLNGDYPTLAQITK